MIPDTLALMVLAVVGVPLAAVLHELTHVAVVWPVAEGIAIDPDSQAVEAEVRDDQLGRLVADLAGVAPVVVGVLVVLASTYAGAPWPAPWDSATGLALWGVWVVYTAAGGLSDYLPSVSRARASSTDDPAGEGPPTEERTHGD